MVSLSLWDGEKGWGEQKKGSSLDTAALLFFGLCAGEITVKKFYRYF